MQIIELVLDEEKEDAGIDCISIVENPAIESNFVALKKQESIQLAEVDKEKRLLQDHLILVVVKQTLHHPSKRSLHFLLYQNYKIKMPYYKY